uniref:phosphoglycerate kinase n=1 Tax=Glossina austeni TaxID=7395 RepID=A0A1A9VH90_GLOAU
MKYLGRHRDWYLRSLSNFLQMGFPSNHFTHVLIDDASQCSETECDCCSSLKRAWPEGSKIVQDLADRAQKNNVQLHLPVDFVYGDKFAEDAVASTVEDGIPDGCMGLDIGPKTRAAFAAATAAAKIIVWNGPPGVFEFDNFAHGIKSSWMLS